MCIVQSADMDCLASKSKVECDVDGGKINSYRVSLHRVVVQLVYFSMCLEVSQIFHIRIAIW